MLSVCRGKQYNQSWNIWKGRCTTFANLLLCFWVSYYTIPYWSSWMIILFHKRLLNFHSKPEILASILGSGDWCVLSVPYLSCAVLLNMFSIQFTPVSYFILTHKIQHFGLIQCIILVCMWILIINMCLVLKEIIILVTNLKIANMQIAFVLGLSSILPSVAINSKNFWTPHHPWCKFDCVYEAVDFDAYEISPRFFLCADSLLNLNLDFWSCCKSCFWFGAPFCKLISSCLLQWPGF